MKKYNYIITLSFIFILNPIFSQDASLKIEKKIDPVIVQPPPEIINYPGLSETSVFEGDRIVFWVHGLGGTDFSWDAAAAPTANTYKMTSLLNGIDYSSYSLSSAGQVLQTTIDGMAETYGQLNGIDDPAHTNFIISHSQGGIVSRAAYKRYADLGVVEQRSFGGIVTFGAPHQGAQIINNVDDIIAFADNSCIALTAGPATEAWNGNWILGLIPGEFMETAITTICGLLANRVLPIVMQDYLEPITEDYQVGAGAIAALNAFDSDPTIPIQKVAFYGIEEAPVVWRTVYSLINDVNAGGSFSASYDEEYVETANTNLNSYYLKYAGYSNLFDALSDQWWAEDWYLFMQINAAQENRDAYYLGYQWWANVEENYLSLIGAVDYEVSSCHCDCLEKYGNDPTPYDVTHSINCGGDCNYFEDNPPPNTNVIHCDYAVVYEKYIKPNDGVVLVESAQNYPGADNGAGNAMLGSNHMQMRNDNNTDEKLFNLMNGDHGFFFITAER